LRVFSTKKLSTVYSHTIASNKKLSGNMKSVHFFCFNGGDRVKFGDILMAVATYAVLQILIAFLLTVVALPAFGVTMFAYYWLGLPLFF